MTKQEGTDLYSDVFCKVYNEFGWNYYPEVFGQQLLTWLQRHQQRPETALDLGCGTGVLCEILQGSGIRTTGMDLSSGMIQIARQGDPNITYEVGNMITYRPDRQFDLVTCTGDALNHIRELEDLRRIFRNVFHYTAPGGYFIFDILNENEVSSGEPFEMVIPASGQYACHVEFNHKFGDYRDCVSLNTLDDTWFIYPDAEDFSGTKMSLAVEEIFKKITAEKKAAMLTRRGK